MKPKKKDIAELRTVDMFSGKTQLEAQEAAKALVDDADVGLQIREKAKSIEEEADRYRTQAFIGQEWTSKNWKSESGNADALNAGTQADTQEESFRASPGVSAQTSKFRLSIKGEWLYLERLGLTKGDRLAYSYAGVMFPKQDLFELTDAIVTAARAMKQCQ